jgi:hypothetical protein
MHRRRGSFLGNAVRGAIAGAAATWVMDLATSAMLDRQSPGSRGREEAARVNRKSSIENLVDRAADVFDIELDAEMNARATQATHYALGIVPGALYGALRDRVPLIGAGGGLVYGALLWAVNDEWLATQLGLAAPPDAYPPETHLRGLVGHLVLGAGTDSGIDLLGG